MKSPAYKTRAEKRRAASAAAGWKIHLWLWNFSQGWA